MQNIDIEAYEMSEALMNTLGFEENPRDSTKAPSVHANDIHFYTQSSDNDDNNQEEDGGDVFWIDSGSQKH